MYNKVMILCLKTQRKFFQGIVTFSPFLETQLKNWQYGKHWEEEMREQSDSANSSFLSFFYKMIARDVKEGNIQ